MADEDDQLRAVLDQLEHAAIEFVPVRTARGKRVHATTLSVATRVACDRRSRRWIVVAAEVNCPNCLLALHLDCRPPRRKRKRRK